MYLLYSFLLSIAFLILLPRFLFDAARHGKYAAGFWQRLGGVPTIDAAGRRVVWLHCVSVGETQAARPVVEELLAAHTEIFLVVSTTTKTGQAVARDAFGKRAGAVIYFPFDWRWTVRRSLARVRPCAVLVMETELWANFLRECRRQDIPVALANGRISPKSMRNYRRVRFFMRRVTQDLTLALMQSDADAERIVELGIPRERVYITGNVKFDAPLADEGIARSLDARFQFSTQKRPLIICASTHDGEETILLSALAELRATHTNLHTRMLFAPRHPERFAAVARLLEARSDLRCVRRSHAPADRDADCDIVLLDSIGELAGIYSLASVVFVGGSLVPHGGHNLLEPAARSSAVVTGAHTANFADIVRAFLDAEALIQLPIAGEAETIHALADTFAELLIDTDANHRLGARAAEVCEANRGATKRTVKLLDFLLNDASESADGYDSKSTHADQPPSPETVRRARVVR